MYENIKILTFSKGSFSDSQIRLQKHLNNIGLFNITQLSDLDLPDDFKSDYSEILKYRRGYGYCIWKPFIILNELKKLKENEILFYIDSTDIPEIPLFDFIDNHFKNNTYLFFNRGFNHGEWTKRDTFVLMNCDSPEYHDAVQLEAGDICLIKNDFNFNIINEWFNNCKNINSLTETPNICGLPNLPTFHEHRYDQSILTNIIIKNKICSYNFNSDKIKYNYNQPQQY